MGDHPVVWTNTKMKARNIYIFMGHSPELLNNASYTTLLRNAIFWAAVSREFFVLNCNIIIKHIASHTCTEGDEGAFIQAEIG
jgi:hypothetical protein